MATSIVYLNGRFLPDEKAKISVFDRGFLFGDGVYEVIPVYAGKPFHLSEHLLRLGHSLEAIRLSAPVDFVLLENALLELLKKNRAVRGDYSIYVQITRGLTKPRSFCFSQNSSPTIFAALQAIQTLSFKVLCRGKSAITLVDTRWRYAHIKSTSLLPSVLLYDQVRGADCDEGILIRDGYAIEGVSSNIFVVSKNKIFTPPLSRENLSGVTRDIVLRLLGQNQISFSTKKISRKALGNADEIWITSSTRGIFPIIKLDNKKVGNGKPGVMWKRVAKLYFDYRKNLQRKSLISR